MKAFMKTQYILTTLLVAIAFFLFSACERNEIQAEKSMDGLWEVTAIHSYYGDFSDNSFNPSETIFEAGQLGTFEFTDNTVGFSFTRNDTTFTGVDSWSIVEERVNAGFTRVSEFRLTIDNHFLFDVTFEDATKNAEENATSVTFVEKPTNGFGVWIEISLEKK
jgi:hypothetical protein